MKQLRNSSLALMCMFLLCPSRAVSQGTAFTHQGLLGDGGRPATGIYDLQFSLFDSLVGESTVGQRITRLAVPVSNGLFTVRLDFGASIFTGPARWLETAVRTNGVNVLWTTLTPRTELTPSPYAMFAGRAATVPNDAIGSAQIAAGAVQSSDILDGTIGFEDLGPAALIVLDGRHVLKSGDTMTGSLRAPGLVAPDIATSRITNTSGILTLKSRTDIELTIDDGGGASAAFEIFNGEGQYLLSVNESADTRVFNDFFVDERLGVGTREFDDDAVAQFNLPPSVSFPRVLIKSPIGNAGFGLQFVNPDETWFVGPNIGNWSDDRFGIAANKSNKGIIIDANGNVGIDGVGDPAPFATLTVDGSIGFPTVAKPMLYIYPSGSLNARKPVIVHSPLFPGYGLFYEDDGERFQMQSSPTDATPSLVVDLDSNWVAINTESHKSGYALSVDGLVVCEDLLIQDSANWPDYVFEEDYPLMTLDDVETHIKEKKHLPGMPTAADLKQEGLPIGDMQRRMMEKIEELTLYVIDQNKRLTAQEGRIRQLEAQLRSQELHP